jgi:hypothetical protein
MSGRPTRNFGAGSAAGSLCRAGHSGLRGILLSRFAS